MANRLGAVCNIRRCWVSKNNFRVLFGPSSIICDSVTGVGWIGLITYSLSAGLPLIVAAHVGGKIRHEFPQVTSISSFVRHRFGRAFEWFIALMVVINVGLALSAEYSAIGSLFSQILDTSAIYPVVIIGCITMIYTAAGGLYVSIITDQYQSIFSLVLLGIVSIYLAIYFRTGPLPPLPPQLAANPLGYASILSLSISLLSSTLMSDAVWQRVWAAKDQKALKEGAWMGAGLTCFVMFYFGLAGFMATWLGIAPEANTAFFALIRWVSQGSSDVGNGTSIWLLALVCIIAVTMNESAVDSFQNALTDTVISLGYTAGKNIPVIYARVAVLIINIPIMIIGVQGYNIGNLYLITNIMTTCSIAPMLMGLLRPLDAIVTGTAALLGSLIGLFSVVVHGWIVTGSIGKGIAHDFFDAGYDWPPFVYGLFGSILGTFVCAGIERLVYRYLERPFPVFVRQSILIDPSSTLVEPIDTTE